MTFEVLRTTSMWGNERPCEEAVKTCVNGKEIYIMDISTLEKLIEFMEKIGYNLVIGINSDEETKSEGLPWIEIYDDWRE